MSDTDNFLEFLKSAIPLAIAFLVSAQISLLVTDLQTTTISPFLGIALNSSSLGNLAYEYNPDVIFKYGVLLNRICSVGITLFIVYIIAKSAKLIGVESTKRL